MANRQTEIINLPRPFFTGGLSLSETISQRRSVRDFSPEPIILFQISQILWAAQGLTHQEQKLRSVPSAGGTYSLEVYVVAGESGIEQVKEGVYYYQVENHALSLHIKDDVQWKLSTAAFNQDSIAEAPVSLVICAVYDRTLARYSSRGERYVYIEVGHTGQNVYLQATALGLGTVGIGAFHDTEVRRLLQLENNVNPIYIMPIGKPAK